MPTYTLDEKLNAKEVKDAYWSSPGTSLKEVADQFGVSKTGLAAFIERNGIDRKPQGRRPKSKSRIKRIKPKKRRVFQEPRYPKSYLRRLLLSAANRAGKSLCSVIGCPSIGVFELGSYSDYMLCDGHFEKWSSWVMRHPAKQSEKRWNTDRFILRFSHFLFESLKFADIQERDLAAMVAEVKYPDGFVCPKCFTRRVDKHDFLTIKCGQCGFKEQLLNGTIFENSQMPLTLWFQLIDWTERETTLSVRKVKKRYCINHKTAHSMLSKVRSDDLSRTDEKLFERIRHTGYEGKQMRLIA